MLNSTNSRHWLADFTKQTLRGKHVLLYGNVTDEFPLGNQYVGVRALLNDYFRQAGYLLVCHYDVVDGIEFADLAMRSTLDAARRPGGAGPIQPEAAPPPAPAMPGRSIGGRAPVQATPAAAPVQPLPKNPEEALLVLREVLRQNQMPTAVILHFSDKLVGDPERQARDEVPALVLIKKMIQEAAVLDGQAIGKARNLRNALVIIAESLGGVAPWLYQANPQLTVLKVPRPGREERHAFADRFLGDFHGGGGLIGEAQAKLADQFADLTDGLTTLDLHALRRTSVREGVPVSPLKQLVDYYKFGVKEDSWASLDRVVRAAPERLRARVIGQDEAIGAVVNMLVSARVGLRFGEGGGTGKPKGTFFFVGPTGVGKTELAKALAELIFGEESALARFDMSEYAMEHAAEKLTGSPPGYVGYDAGGQLTNRVLERPFSLLLFDEIEKADGKIMDKFLQILEDGRLTDSRGQTADFSQSVVIFTSNIGSDGLSDLEPGEDRLPSRDRVREHYLEAVRQHFTRKLGRPELLNRLGDNILVFDVLRPKHVRGIVHKMQRALETLAREQLGITLHFAGEEVATLIGRLMEDPKNLQMGGRRVRTLMEEVVLKPLNRHLFERGMTRGATLTVCVPPHSGEIQVR